MAHFFLKKLSIYVKLYLSLEPNVPKQFDELQNDYKKIFEKYLTTFFDLNDHCRVKVST